VAAPPGPEVIPDDTDIATCLRILAQAKETDPGNPLWARVHDAAAQVYRAGKKSRKAARYADRRRHDRELLGDSARYQEQNPSPAPVPAPPQPSAPERRLIGARRCYSCKAAYREVHPDYHLLCPGCRVSRSTCGRATAGASACMRSTQVNGSRRTW
jgi:hypothetical protein